MIAFDPMMTGQTGEVRRILEGDGRDIPRDVADVVGTPPVCAFVAHGTFDRIELGIEPAFGQLQLTLHGLCQRLIGFAPCWADRPA